MLSSFNLLLLNSAGLSKVDIIQFLILTGNFWKYNFWNVSWFSQRPENAPGGKGNLKLRRAERSSWKHRYNRYKSCSPFILYIPINNPRLYNQKTVLFNNMLITHQKEHIYLLWSHAYSTELYLDPFYMT